MAALNHPHICQIYDVGPTYLVLEYIEGEPPRGPMAAGEAVRLAIQIASALEAAHRRGILHRDLKPANIIQDRSSSAKVLDFGLAKLIDTAADVTRTMDGMVVGTVAYMSPEQAEGLPLDERSDIFSFGAVLYEILDGPPGVRWNRLSTSVGCGAASESPSDVNRACTRPYRPALSRKAVGRSVRFDDGGSTGAGRGGATAHACQRDRRAAFHCRAAVREHECGS